MRLSRPTRALQALRLWTKRQWLFSAVSAALLALGIGVATVLIPNPVFVRDIAPVWWNYPVLIITAVLSGLLVGTYVKPYAAPAADTAADLPETEESSKPGTFGMIGAVLGWFAVGCPVCNKIALLALGYTGALTWFAPFQPVLAVAAILLTGWALLVRLEGQIACAVPAMARR